MLRVPLFKVTIATYCGRTVTITRRGLVQRAAMAATALCSQPIATFAGTHKKTVIGSRTCHLARPRSGSSPDTKLTGQLITPAVPEYNSARLLFDRAFDRHPRTSGPPHDKGRLKSRIPCGLAPQPITLRNTKSNPKVRVLSSLRTPERPYCAPSTR